jgi:hypothetical protein
VQLPAVLVVRLQRLKLFVLRFDDHLMSVGCIAYAAGSYAAQNSCLQAI